MKDYSPEDLVSLIKERPKNETKKRFVLSPEEFLKERIIAVKNQMAEIQAKYPEAISFCMFGSMVKGTAHKGSDIDGYLFIDSELTAQKDGVSEEKVLEHNQTLNATYLTPEKSKKYILEFRNGIKEKTGLEDKDVEHIRSRPISEKIIDDEIATLVAHYRSLEKYELDSDKWFDSKPPRGSDVGVLLAYEKSKPVRPESIRPSLGEMFHLDVGGGIKKYRKLFIDKLSKLGADGEKIWEDTILGTEMRENNFSKDSTKRYPRTLAEAVNVYGG